MPLKNVQSLGYVILLCNDLTKMRDFYQDVLNLKINDETEDWIEIRIGPTLLSLRPRGRWYDGSLCVNLTMGSTLLGGSGECFGDIQSGYIWVPQRVCI